MSRNIDIDNPDSWDDDDKDYLRNRVDTVPQEHRHYLDMPDMTPAPVAVAEHPSIARLREFIERNLPERVGEDPVDVVIDELGGDQVVEDSGDDYDQWKVSELETEARKRQMDQSEMPSGAEAKKKQPWIDALRKWDAEHPS